MRSVLISTIHSPFHYVGGIETFVLHLSSLLVKSGIDVHILSEPCTGEKVYWIPNIEVHHHVIDQEVSVLELEPYSYMELLYKEYRKGLERVLSSYDIDTVVTNFFLDTMACIDLVEELGKDVNIVLFVHDTVGDLPKGYRDASEEYEYRLYRKICGKDVKVVVFSYYMYSYVRDRISKICRDIEVDVLGGAILDPELIEYGISRNVLEEKLRILEKKRLRIVHPGRPIPRKMHAITIEIVKRLIRSGISVDTVITPWVFPREVHVDRVLVRAYMKFIEDLASDASGVDFRVVDYSTALDLYRSSHFVLLPSLLEPFGYAAIESMMLGTPVIGTTSGALPEIVWHCRNGFLIRCSSRVEELVFEINERRDVELIHRIISLLDREIRDAVSFLRYIVEDPSEYLKLSRRVYDLSFEAIAEKAKILKVLS